MRRFCLLYIILALSTLRVVAQTTFNVEAPRIAALGEPFRVEFTLNDKPDDFVAPDFGSFDVIAGPSISEGTSFSSINGKTTRSFNITYTYVLVANQTGNQTIGSAKASVDGKNYTTKAYPIEIVQERSTPGANAQQGQQSQQSQGQSQRAGASSNSIAKDDILLRITVNKSNVYRGEAILADVKLYCRAQVVGFDGFKVPAFNGFWTQEVDLGGNQQSVRETFDGKIYDVITIKRYLLFPQKSGELKIERMDATPVVRIVTATSASGSLFDSMFGGGQSVQNVRREIASAPVTINVKELPSAPASFCGAVGSFTMDATLSSDNIAANSSGNVTVTINGTGNLPLVTTPTVNMPTSFEQYSVKSSDNMSVTSSGMKGYKRYEYPFIARAEGDYIISPVEFTYFDISEGRYKTLSSKEFDITVTPDSGASSNKVSSAAIVSGVTKEELKILDSDINYIVSNMPKLSKKGSYYISSLPYWLLYLLAVAIFIATIIYLNKRIKEMRDIVKVRNKRANKVALKRLKSARAFMLEGRQNAFYAEMIKVMMGYVGDKLNVGVSDLTKEYMQSELIQRGVSREDVELLIQTLSDCEYSQYAPTEGVQMSNIYQATLDLIDRVENSLKKA